MITTILPEMKPMRDLNDFTDGDKLFYELGYKKDPDKPSSGNWIRTGRFKEIKNPKQAIQLDKRMSDHEYLEHHNFMIIKGGGQ